MLQEHVQRSYKLRNICFACQPRMFLENTEVKQRWQSVLNDFALKSGTNKKAFKFATTLNKKREVEKVSFPDADVSMGFVGKFCEVMRLQKKNSKISAEILKSK